MSQVVAPTYFPAASPSLLMSQPSFPSSPHFFKGKALAQGEETGHQVPVLPSLDPGETRIWPAELSGSTRALVQRWGVPGSRRCTEGLLGVQVMA